LIDAAIIMPLASMRWQATAAMRPLFERRIKIQAPLAAHGKQWLRPLVNSVRSS
jgi:lipopolysaccharide biosynthesis protein